jgi:hypothetical protein
LIEYATRNDDAVRNSTWTVYGMRLCSRSDTRIASIASRDCGEQPIGHARDVCV